MNVTLLGLLWAVATSDDATVDNYISDDDGSNPTLPDFERVVPKQGGMNDKDLQQNFPGQFYTDEQIASINSLENQERERRNTDYDLCCPTKVWFGPAPDTMRDIDGKEWTIVCGGQVQQAFSRGDCVNQQPNDRCVTNRAGLCKQKTRLVWLWVEKESGSQDYLYKYFRTNSHCAYESIPTPPTDKQRTTTTVAP